MNRIITRAQTCALAVVLFCAPNALAIKKFKKLPIESNPEAKNISKNILIGPVMVMCDGGDSGSFGYSTLLDNNLLAIVNGQKIGVWDLISGKNKYSLNHGCLISSPPLSLSGNMMASFGGEKVKIFDLKNGSCKNEIIVGNCLYSIRGLLRITKDTVAIQTDKSIIQIWDLETKQGKCNYLFNDHYKKIHDLVRITDKCIVSGSSDKSVRVWDLETGKCACTFFGYSGKILKLLKISDEVIASGDSKGIINIFGLKSGECISTLVGEKGWINNLIISSNSIIVGYLGGNMQMWDLSTEKLLKNLVGHTKTINGLIAMNDDTLISCSDDKTIKVWDLNKGIWVKSIDCGDTVKNIFMTEIQNISTIVAVTFYRKIITFPCKFISGNVNENIIQRMQKIIHKHMQYA